MSLLDSITLLIEANRQYLKNSNNKVLEEKKNRLRYYFLNSLKNSPEKAIVVKRYLENILKNMEKRNIKNMEYVFIKEIYKDVDSTYLIGLKDLTLDQKKTFFSKNHSHLLYKKDKEIKKNLSI